MCGLTGFMMSAPPADCSARSIVVEMAKTLHHRGPDACGAWTDDKVAFGHARLSVLELSEAGSQPMHSQCGRYLAVFNGEIYNHLELRSELVAAGYSAQWRGHSDTETLLAGIAVWGLDEALLRAAGMFAIALWDRKLQKLSLARDRMGEKPLYWGWAGSNLVFGSELKALRKHPSFAGGVCKAALAQYLTFGYVPAPYSIHPSIYKLEPACILEVDGEPPAQPPDQPLRPGEKLGSLAIRKYWSFTEDKEDNASPFFDDFNTASREVESSLSVAVIRQMISDVPLGAFLSGGIDSSLIVALMQQRATQRVKTFTIGFEAKAFDEAPHAAAVATHIGTDHHEMMVTQKEARCVIPTLPKLYDEPFGDSSQIPTHLVARVARSHVTVALTGDGGDELFGGYNRYFWAPRVWGGLSKIPKPMRHTLNRIITSVPDPVWDRVEGFFNVSQAGDKAQKLAASIAGVGDITDLYRNLVTVWPGHSLVLNSSCEAVSLLNDPLPPAYDDDAVAWMMVQDMRTYLPDDILCKVDRAGMGVSLETRVPFLDPGVIDVARRLPTAMKVKGGTGKLVLRDILDRHVPRSLIERPKTGFSIPLGEWLRGPLREWAEGLLSVTRLRSDGLIDPEPVRATWMEHLSGRRDWAHRLWVVLMFQAWLVEQAPVSPKAVS